MTEDGAREAGPSQRETTLVIFGSPAAGTPVMAALPLTALDLPLKIVVWADDGQTKVSYYAPAAIGRVAIPGPPLPRTPRGPPQPGRGDRPGPRRLQRPAGRRAGLNIPRLPVLRQSAGRALIGSGGRPRPAASAETISSTIASGSVLIRCGVKCSSRTPRATS